MSRNSPAQCASVNKVQYQGSSNFWGDGRTENAPSEQWKKELRHAGLVEKIKDGRKVALQVNPDKLEELKDFLKYRLIDKPRTGWRI